MIRAFYEKHILRKRGIFRLVKLYSQLFHTTTDVSTIYDKDFYDKTVEKEASSAGAMVKILSEEFQPSRVIDVGCGVGIYLAAFEKLGVEIHGCDGSENAIQDNLVGAEHLELVDLREPQSFPGEWDLCICFEVAEHLPPEHAPTLVKTLTEASDQIVFTAAAPGQGGTHHYNEQPKEYWKKLFKSYGFVFLDDATKRVRRKMRKKDVIFWLEQNLMIFRRATA